MFCNIEEILFEHLKFVKTLEESLDRLSYDEHFSIGHIFIEMVSFFFRNCACV